MQPQPQQQPPRPNDSLDGIDKQLRATTINSVLQHLPRRRIVIV